MKGSGFISTRHSSPGLKAKGSTSAAGANVKGSRLNKGSDQNWRGKRGGVHKASHKTKMYS